MKVLKSYVQGIKRATLEVKMLLLLWLFNILFASIVYVQFSDYLRGVFGASGAAANFLKTFDFNTFTEIMTFDGAGMSAVVSLALFLALVYGIFSIFLSAGILQTLFAGRSHGIPGEKRRLAPLFFQGAGKFFGRFFRLFVYSLALWAGGAVVMLIVLMILSPVFQAGTNEALMFYVGAAAAVFGLFLIFLVMMIVDYARIRIVVENSSAVLKSLLRSVGFVLRRFGKTLALYYLYLLTGAAVIGVYWAVRSGLETHAVLPILIAFLVGQIFIIARGWLKVGLQAAQMDLFLSAAPPEPQAPPDSGPEA